MIPLGTIMYRLVLYLYCYLLILCCIDNNNRSIVIHAISLLFKWQYCIIYIDRYRYNNQSICYIKNGWDIDSLLCRFCILLWQLLICYFEGLISNTYLQFVLIVLSLRPIILRVSLLPSLPPSHTHKINVTGRIIRYQ